MRVVQLDFADREFPASLVEIDSPGLPGPDWARVEVVAGGICGSDLHMFAKAATGPTPLLGAFATLPMDLGHEIAGRVVEAGPDCPTPVGTAVAVDPVIACEARGIAPRCPKCDAGIESACVNLGSGIVTAGMGLGFTSGLGGGWADEVVAHRSMLHPLPPAVHPRDASLHEPLSIAVHGLQRQPAPDDGPVLVLGAGVIGLAAVAAVRFLHPAAPVTAVARYPHQAEAARALGADHVVTPTEDGAHFDALADIAGTRAVRTPGGPMLLGGFPYVVEAVGSGETITEALRLVDGRGTVLLLGAAGVSKVDLTPVWFKEAAVVGAFCHSHHPGGHSIDRALEMMATGRFPADLVITHRFALDDVRTAVATGLDRASGAIKVVLRA